MRTSGLQRKQNDRYANNEGHKAKYNVVQVREYGDVLILIREKNDKHLLFTDTPWVVMPFANVAAQKVLTETTSYTQYITLVVHNNQLIQNLQQRFH